MAFFPLFLGAESTPITLLLLLVHITAISFIIQAGLVLVDNAAAVRLSKWKYARLVSTRLAGVVFIGLGVKLALNNR